MNFEGRNTNFEFLKKIKTDNLYHEQQNLFFLSFTSRMTFQKFPPRKIRFPRKQLVYYICRDFF